MRGYPIAILLMLCGSPAIANDSTAEVKTGGLKLTKTDDIEMRSEDLFISTAEIRVVYRFFNRSPKDIVTIVAFPMPDIKLQDEDIALPDSASDNFLDFVTTVDGVAVPAVLEQHAMVGSVDHTDDLRQVGSSLLPQVHATAVFLEALPINKQDQLIKLGLVALEDVQDNVRHLQLKWTLRSLYSWTQTFPAGRDITVEHHYKPSVGISAGTGLASSGGGDPDYIHKYCIEPSFLASIKPNVSWSEQRVSYVLKTGANWAEPIGEFRLVVDKGSASNLVSFCGSDIEKIGVTRFQIRRRNFRPDTDIDVLILTRVAN